MMRQLHVVYEKGVLRPLEPVDFAEKQVFVVIVTDEEVVAPVKPEPTTYRTLAVEMQWLKEHGNEYVDQWVVVEGDRLISHGMDGKAVYDEARAAGVSIPFLTHVAKPDDLPWGGW